VARGEEVSPPAAETTTAQVEEAGAAPLNDGDLDIKEIMARLEIAAERAQLRADEDARRDRSDLDPEVLDQAVGGRA
jgi:hypothetical protein